LGDHPYLGVFVGLGTVITILVIAASYSQIVELFPTGGGGYFVATKLLSPWVGMVSGCALLIDYILTISVSIASGADAIFSFLPLPWHEYKLELAGVIVIVMMLLNISGEGIGDSAGSGLSDVSGDASPCDSVRTFHPLAPDGHSGAFGGAEVHDTVSTVGFWGLVFILPRSHSMGSRTYTGMRPSAMASLS
jgi:hypothetical protein